MQGDKRPFHAPLRQPVEQCLLEVQAGGGRGHRAGLAGVDGLIALGIFRGRLAANVGRQRRLPVPFQQRQPRFVAVGADFEQLAVAAEYGGGKARLEQQRTTRLGRLAGVEMNQRPPLVQQPLDQNLDPSAAGLAAEQPRRDDPGVVEHQQIAGPQQRRQFAE